MFTRQFLTILLFLLASAGTRAFPAPTLAWQAGTTTTINYTPGAYFDYFDLLTNATSVNSIAVVSGSMPTGMGFGWGNCGPAYCGEFYAYGIVSGPATSVVIRATRGGETADLTVNFVPAFSLTGTVTATGIVGSAYSSGVSTSGGTSPYTWDISGGALPGGLSISSSTGAITGTPTAAGNYNFTVRATDNTLAPATSAQSIQIYAALSVSTSSLAPTTAGASYSQTLAATGGTTPTAWSIVTGSLPPGLSLSGAGAITGTATTAGTYNFTVQVGCCSTGVGQAALSIVVNAPPAITTSSLPDVAPGGSYSQTLAATGGTGALTWTVTAGSLPGGLTLNSSTGAITGTASASGTFPFSAHVADSMGIGSSQVLSIVVVAVPTVTTTTLAPVTVGQSVSASVAATSGTSPYTWAISAGSLPAGISLDTSGAITGTPTAAGAASFTVRVTDGNSQQGAQAITWTVNARPSITTSSLPDTTVGAAYSQTLAGSGGTGALTWSVSTGSLPAGLSLNASTGAITGTSTAAVSSGLVFSLTDSNSVAGTQGLGLIVNAAPAVTTSTLPRGVTATAYAQTLSSSGGTGALTWSISAGSLPAGLTLNTSTGAITGTPTSTGTTTFTARVVDTLSVAGTQALSIQVVDHPDITTTTLSAVTVGQTVSAPVTATAGTPAYTWSLASGSLPAGISLNSSTGALTGNPTTAGTATFSLKVADANSLEDTQALTWTVNGAPSVITTTLPATTVGATYSQTLDGTGGTGAGTWSVSTGSLPAGLTLNASSGALSGSPTAAGTASFTVSYTDQNSIAGTQNLSVAVNAAPVIVTTTLPQAVTAVAYSQALSSNGGTGAHSWTVSSGALPAGLALNASTGAITGTPTTVGTANFTVQAADTLHIAGTHSLSIQVVDVPDITTTTLSAATVGQSVSTAVAAQHGTTPYVWSIASGALPAGINLNASTGALAGVPTTGGTASFSIKVTDGNTLDDTQALTWAINGAASISTSTLPTTTLGAVYSQTLAGSGGTGTLTWSISSGSLPAGLSLNASTGAITGTSSASGTASFVVSLTDTNSIAATKSLSILVNAAPSITPSTLPHGVVGSAYSQTLAASGGTGAYVWSLASGALPAGLSLSTAGNLTGTPTASGTPGFTVRVTDSLEVTGTRPLTLEIVNIPVITTLSLPPAEQGTAGARPLAASAGTPPYTWSITSGALPPDTTLTPAGVLTGAPAITGTYSFTVTVSDANHLEDHRALTWAIVAAPPTISGGDLPKAYRNSPYFAPLVSSGGVSPRRWSMISGTLPPGLSLAADGSVSGTATATGAYSFTLQLIDGAELSASGTFSLEVEDRPQFRVSPESLSFSAKAGAGPTAPQQVEVTSTPAAAPFSITSDHEWLHVSVDRSNTPAVVNVIADPAGLAPGSYAGVIAAVGAESRSIPVTFTVDAAPNPSLDVAPGQITITTSREAGVERRILVAHSENASGTVAVRSLAPWITVSEPALSNAGRDATITVTVDPSGFDNGSHEGALLITRGPSLERNVPVQLIVAATRFDVSHSGLSFEAAAGGTGVPAQQLFISNETATPLNWQASVSADAPWIRLGTPSGTADPTSPLGVQVNTSSLTAGVYSGSVTVAPQLGGTPRAVEVRLNLVAGAIRPQVAPRGLAFIATTAVPASGQQIVLSNPQAVETSYVSHLSPESASSWLMAGPASGTLPAGGAATLLAQTQSSALALGVHHADLTIEFADQTVQVVHVTLTITADTCVASRLVPVLTKPGDHFQVRAGWPTAVEVLVNDDCGHPVSDGSGLMQFSDPNEPALALIPAPGGRWTATWFPAGEQTSISADLMLQDVARTKTGALIITGAVGTGGGAAGGGGVASGTPVTAR